MADSASPKPVRLSVRAYESLLQLYPREYRYGYGEPMSQLFADCCAAEFAGSGYRGLVRVWGEVLRELGPTVWEQHLAVRRAVREPLPAGLTPDLTPWAQEALSRARVLAAARGAAQTAPYELLGGLLCGGPGAARRVLTARSHRHQVGAVRKALWAAPGESVGGGASRPLPEWADAAAREAARLGHPFVGTEHLLLALLNDPTIGVDELLHPLGLRAEEVRDGLLRLIATPL
jgi:hypothetical protein